MIQRDVIAVAAFAALVVAAASLIGWSSYRHGVQTERAVWERKQAKAEEQAKELAEANAAETARRFSAQQAIINETLREKENARLDADRASAAGERLRKQIATLTAACRATSDPGAIGSGEAADASGDLLNGVLERLDEAANRIARHADEARAAGLACERSYDVLNNGGPNG